MYRFRQINIVAVLNGFVVTVGCQTVVFSTVEALVSALRDYYNEPENTEKRFTSSEFSKHVYSSGDVMPATHDAPPTMPGGDYTSGTNGMRLG